MANDVLTGLARRRRLRVAVAGVAAALAFAVALPIAATRLGGSGQDVGSVPTNTPVPEVVPRPEPRLARPGGGPVAIHLYRTDTASYLLDVEHGKYVAIEGDGVALSPDGTKVAVAGPGGRLAVADRSTLLSGGLSSLVWTDVTGGRPEWSPDGKAVLAVDVVKAESGATQFVRRYDVATGESRSTPLPADAIDAGWASDSTGYLALRGTKTGGWFRPGALQYLAPDGTWGSPVIADLAGPVLAHSPTGRYLLTDSSQVDAQPRSPSKIVEVSTGTVVAETAGKPVGWYDDTRFIRLVGAHRVEVVDVATGTVTRWFDFEDPLGDHALGLEFGPSNGLTGDAAAYGF